MWSEWYSALYSQPWLFFFQSLYKSSEYSVLFHLQHSNPTSSDPGYLPPGSTGSQEESSGPLKEDVANSKSVMIIMIVAPVCAGVVLVIIGCILLVWYMRYVQFKIRRVLQTLFSFAFNRFSSRLANIPIYFLGDTKMGGESRKIHDPPRMPLQTPTTWL